MSPLLVKLLAGLAFTIAIFTAGWQVKSAFVAKEQLGIEKVKDEFVETYRELEGAQSALLEKKLTEFKQNDKIIERERIKIVERPVYSNNCLDSDGLSIIERARTGKADTIEPANYMPRANQARRNNWGYGTAYTHNVG